MKCSFSPSALTDLLRLAAGLGLFAASAHAQQPAPAAAPRSPGSAYVRLWNMLPAKDAPAVQLLSAEDKVIATAPPLNYGAAYNPIAPGSYTFTVRKGNDDTGTLKRQPMILRKDVYVTWVVAEKNGQTTVEAIDDTSDPKKLNNPSQLVVRQYIPGARVTVSTREGLASQEIGYGDSTILGNLPNQVVFLTMKASGLGPEAKVWSTEADFATYRHATLLIVADPYGRFRPRLSYDGQTAAAMQAALDPSQASSPRP